MIIPAVVVVKDLAEVDQFVRASESTDVYDLIKFEVAGESMIIARYTIDAPDMIAMVFALHQAQAGDQIIMRATREHANAAYASYPTNELLAAHQLIRLAENL